MDTHTKKANPLLQTIRLISVLLALCPLFFPISAFCQDLGKITLGGFDYPPFYSRENGEIQGIAVELIDELSKRLNIDTELRIYPLKRALSYMKKGLMDGAMFLIKTPERAEYLHYSDPIITIRGLIWSVADRKGGPVEFETLEDLRPYRIGVTIGYSYGKEFDKFLKTMKVYEVPMDLHNYKKLLLHRIDIFPGNEIVAKGLFKKHPELRGKFIHSSKSFIEWTLHMTVSKKSPFASMIPEINRVLADFKNEGFIDEIVRKYTEPGARME
jgi:polar amino acid transport system substrate-binding protein